MTESIQTYSNDALGVTVRTVDEGGQVLFCAKDVAAALGYSDPTNAVKLHCKGVANYHPLQTRGGTQNVRFITEPDLYRLVAHSKLPAAERFEAWVFEEVLPAIRRTGGYVAAAPDEGPEAIMARALLVARDTMERQRARIADLEPKARFADAVSASDGTCLVGELAKMMRQNGVEVGQNRLFRWLREDGYLGKSGCNRNVPTQRAMEMGLFRIKETAVTHSDGHVTVNRTPKVTGKGQRHLMERYCAAREIPNR